MHSKQTPVIYFAWVAFILLVVTEFIAILCLNNGVFIFTLDDPYIHLALAENLLKGHYGVNLHEYSAPSSSILWPFFIAPISWLTESGILLLVLNTVFALASLSVFDRIIDQALQMRGEELKRQYRLALLLAFIVVANLAGLAFTGMEHNLQVFLALVVLLGLLKVSRGEQATASLWCAIVLMPLVRYETAALSAAALLFLFIQKYRWQSFIAGVVITLLLGGFSAFLISIGLGYLPDSVLAKSDVANSGLAKLFGNFQANVLALSPPMPKGLALLIAALFLCWQARKANKKPFKKLSYCLVLAILLHLLAGRIGWLWRYELYIWAVLFAALVVMVLQYKDRISKIACAVVMLVSLEHLIALAIIPQAASNIYLQQYQMHRFITEVYKKPVAINDLGWPSYHNPYYVLDLWGLGSSKARELRKSAQDSLWMDNLAELHQVDLIMIYHDPIWFPEVPQNWLKLGLLDSDRVRITARMPVSIFTRCVDCKTELLLKLQDFATTLPEGAMFIAEESVKRQEVK